MQIKSALNSILFCIIMLSTNGIVAQQARLSSEVYPEHRYYPLKGEVFYGAYRQVRGSAYLFDDWVVGDIKLSTGKALNDVQYKIDVYSHYLLVYNDYLKRVIVLEQKDIAGFSFEDAGHKREFKRIKASRNIKQLHDEFFQEVLLEGHISFYRLYYRDIIPLRSPEMPFIEEFVNGESYYIVYQGDWENVRLRRSSIINKFPAYKSEIKQFARKNKLRFKRESDLVEVLNYLGQIIQLVDEAR